MSALVVTNTISRKKERFSPQQEGKVTLYVCGITPYDYAHLGHGRCYVTFDLLYRLLQFLGLQVTYCRNFTDIDDKLLNRAQQDLGDRHRYGELADKFIAAYQVDMQRLNCRTPDVEPRVTQNMPAIIAFIKGLVDAGIGYVVDGDVYFSIDAFPAYGKLSGRALEDLRAGARVEVDERKRNPLDFALWKSEPKGEFWESPWSWGRPGWHIECSALAQKYLGTTIDIHAGGMDLIFPHHENELAQSEGLHGVPFVRYWMHNAFVQINKEKMSKSLGNFFTLQQLFKEIDPMVVRYYILQHQYRTPLDFSLDDLKAAQKSYQKLCRAFANTPAHELKYADIAGTRIVEEMLKFLLDDLNNPGLFGVLFEHLREIEQSDELRVLVKSLLVNVLGLQLEPLPEKKVAITPEIQKLIDDREAARAAKDWAKADALRDQLHALGVDVQDKKRS